MKNIWIKGDNLLGDYLMQTPAIRGLQRKFPTLPIRYITSPNSNSRELIKNTPGIVGTYTESQARMIASKSDIIFKADAGDAFSVGVRLGITMPQAFCSLWGVDFDGGWFDLNTPQTTNYQEQFGNYVVLARHSRSCTSNDVKIRIANKCLKNDFWLMVMNELEKRNITPIVVGAAEDETDPTYQDITHNTIKFYGNPIMQLAELIRDANYVISVDTGIRHMAAAIGNNLITLNHAIPLSLIRCEPRHPNQKIAEINVNIHDSPNSFNSLLPLM